MSLLTRIGNLKSKYRETAGYITQERAAIQGIMGKRAKALRDSEGIKKRATAASQEFVSTYGTQADMDSFDLQNIDFSGMRDAFLTRQTEQFKQTSGYRDYANWRRYIQYGGGPHMMAIYERAAQGRADYDRLIAKPMEAMQTTFDNISSISDEMNTTFDTISSYDTDISAAQQRLEGYGASQQEIQGMISEAQQMYGMSTEQRKRGTRGSARRRTALTSRSGYA